MYEYMTGSLLLLAIWLAIYFARKDNRKELLWASLVAAPLALTEPFFVPEYWAPSVVLALPYGFDIESFIFCFTSGGIASVAYEFFFGAKHVKLHAAGKSAHKYHKLTIASAPLSFFILILFTNLNPIYSGSIAMFIGGMAAIFCRPDLKEKVFASGAIFLVFYFLFFLFFDMIFPGYVQSVWNIEALTGIFVFGVPFEELMYAFTFGMFWSSLYEHLNWYALKK